MGQPKALKEFPKRGEVYLVRFDPTVGAEIRKTRPALVVQNDIGNRFGETTIVAAISSTLKLPLSPVAVLIPGREGGLEADSLVRLDHLRSVDKSRLLRRLGTVSAETMHDVDQAIAISLGLVAL